MANMTPEGEEKMLKIIDECPQSRLQGMMIGARVSIATGKKDGVAISGGYKGYWREEKGEAVIYALTRDNESLDDYYPPQTEK